MSSITGANRLPVWQTANSTRDDGREGDAGYGRPDAKPRPVPAVRQPLRVIQGGGRAPANPAPEPATAERLARVIFMASVGGYMAVHHGQLVEVDGRMIWPSAASLAADALTRGIVASTMVINTARG